MACDLPRPRGGHRIVPRIDTGAVIVGSAVAPRQIELDDVRPAVGQDRSANRPPQLGKIGFLFALARDQHEIGGIDRADACERQLCGISTTDTDQGQCEGAGHGSSLASAPNKITAVAGAPSSASCSASFSIVVRMSRWSAWPTDSASSAGVSGAMPYAISRAASAGKVRLPI